MAQNNRFSQLLEDIKKGRSMLEKDKKCEEKENMEDFLFINRQTWK
jgi:hypothetical protein